MASSSHTQHSDEEIDVLCGALCAKLLPAILTGGTSRCVRFSGELLTPCKFERRARRSSSKN